MSNFVKVSYYIDKPEHNKDIRMIMSDAEFNEIMSTVFKVTVTFSYDNEEIEITEPLFTKNLGQSHLNFYRDVYSFLNDKTRIEEKVTVMIKNWLKSRKGKKELKDLMNKVEARVQEGDIFNIDISKL